MKKTLRTIGTDGRKCSPPFHNIQTPFYKAPIFIAHYIFQSEGDYKRRKIDLPRDDTSTMREIITDLHSKHNERDTVIARHKYVNRVRKFLFHKGVIK